MSLRSNHNDSRLTFALVTIAILAIVAMVAYHVMNKPDNRTVGERFGDAVEDVGDGADDAARNFQDRTPAEKLGDAAEEAGDDIQDSVR